ncbi:MAG: hypothetical protein Q7R62_01200 [bacterium]|nr:hypothetical protein [bacterium]
MIKEVAGLPAGGFIPYSVVIPATEPESTCLSLRAERGKPESI